MVTVDWHGVTDVGKVRTVNEDQFLLGRLRKIVEIDQTSLSLPDEGQVASAAKAHLMMVADGVGGGRAGEEASGLATESVVRYVTNTMRCFFSLDEKLQADLLGEWAAAVKRSHLAVRAQAAEDPDRRGMATTLTMVHVLWPHAYVVQVGDSRCYWLRNERLEQVTRDQTVAQHLVDAGALAPESASQSPYSHVLSSAVGIEHEDVEPVISRVDLEYGDHMLLCSDGLTKHVADDEIARHLLRAASARDACESLLAAALNAGGRDNVTVVVSRFFE